MKLGFLIFEIGLVSAFGQTVISTYAGGGPPPTPVAAAKASIAPLGLAFDSAGNQYFTSSNCIFKADTGGIVTRIAGDSRPVHSGDGGLAINAELSSPAGLAFDATGNLFIADGGWIRKISTAGIISSVAGNGLISSSGDGGPAIKALVAQAYGLAFDSSGNLYFSELSGNTVRKISTSGIVTRVAGDFSAGFSGDNGPATQAFLHEPMGIAIDGSGNLLIADYANNRVRKVTQAGVITTYVGDGTCCFSGSGGPSTQAQLNFPMSLTVDGAGNLYIGDEGRIRMVSPSGIFITIAGGGTEPPGSGGPAIGVQVDDPQGLAVDRQGNLYFADRGDFRIRIISTAGFVTTAIGTGTYQWGDGGLAVNSYMNTPSGLAFDGANNLYIVSAGNSLVRKVSPAGIITTVAGNGTSGFSGDGGPATNAQFAYANFPGGILVDSVGTIYISDVGNNRIRAVSPSGIITTFAGGGKGGDNGPATSAVLSAPLGLAIDASGNLYVSEAAGNRVRRISPSGTITTVAGNGVEGYSGDGGPATSAELNLPAGLAVDATGNLYIADAFNKRVRKVSPQGIITTAVGSGGDGSPYCPGSSLPAAAAGFGEPVFLALDSAGNLYIGDANHFCVSVLSPSGILSSIAGNGVPGYSGDGGPPTAAELSEPQGLAFDAYGNLYIADFYAAAVRVIQPAAGPIAIHNVVNGASNVTNLVAPGEIVVITGTGLGPPQLVSAASGNGIFGTQLAGTTVLFDGTPAPMIYSSATQIAAIVPYEISGFSTGITVKYQGRTAATYSVAVVQSLPAIFTLNSTGTGPAAALNQDGTLNTATSPAAAGSIIVLYVTGEGQTTPQGIDGKLAVAPIPMPNLPVTVTIGGVQAQIVYAGGAPGEVAGLMQINAVIPATTPGGNAVPVSASVGNTQSPPGVTISIR